MNIHRHGELILLQIGSIPINATLIKETKSEILAHSESGHNHVLEAPTKFKIYELDGLTYLDLGQDSSLVHQKQGADAHKTQTIKKGLYKSIIKKEFNLYQKIMQKVRD